VLETFAGLLLGAALDLADELGQQQAERQRPARHFGLAVDQAGAKQAFERAHQAPFIPFQVIRQGGAAIADLVVIGIEKHHGRQCRFTIFQGQQ
jgi:hypothetical protein